MRFKFFIVYYFLCLFIALGVLLLRPVYAADCQANSGMPVNETVTLTGTFYAGNEIPVGTVIYRNNVLMNNGSVVGINCNASATVPHKFSVSSQPSGGPFSQSGTPYNGQIYPTNVPGVGVALWYGGTTFTAVSPYQFGNFVMPGAGSTSTGEAFDFSLIKTGPISSGAVVNGSSIPQFKGYADLSPGNTGLPITLRNVTFNGSIRFVSPTCTTPDLTVNMGSYDRQANFTGVGSVTKWVDSSIVLQNCPTFTGYHGANNPQQTRGTATVSGGGLDANILTVSLQPTTAMIDSANGVFAVNNVGSTGSAATGVGIQLGYSTNINASPINPTTIWKSGNTWSVTPPNNGTPSFKIPLAARYYQTGTSVTPGPANGQITFIIGYQ